MTDSARSYPQGTVDSSTAVTSTGINEGPGGGIGWHEGTSGAGPTSTDMDGPTISAVPVNGGRLIRIIFSGVLRATGPTGMNVKIREDSTNLNRLNLYTGGSGRDTPFTIVAHSHSPSAGNHDYTLTFGISFASGEQCSLVIPSGGMVVGTVEDLGPDF